MSSSRFPRVPGRGNGESATAAKVAKVAKVAKAVEATEATEADRDGGSGSGSGSGSEEDSRQKLSEVEVILTWLLRGRSMDHLHLGQNKNVFQVLALARDKDIRARRIDPSVEETVLFSDNVTKVNRRGKSQTRVLLITSLALYNMASDFKKYKRRILLAHVNSVTLSDDSDDFLIHVKDEYDYHYRTHRRAEIVQTISRLRRSVGLADLEVRVASSSNISSHVVTKKLASVWHSDPAPVVAVRADQSRAHKPIGHADDQKSNASLPVARSPLPQRSAGSNESNRGAESGHDSVAVVASVSVPASSSSSSSAFSPASAADADAGVGVSEDSHSKPKFGVAEEAVIKYQDDLGVSRPSFTPFTQFRHWVSKKKRRFQEDGFDLDLTYITERLIAMGYPSEGAEGMYRNPYAEVYRFLQQRHADHYKVYNLCSERHYDPVKFHYQVAVYPFDDHNCPSIQLILEFCHDVTEFLARHPENVVAVHCKAGKGRTGLMLSAYMVWADKFPDFRESLKFFGDRRTMNGKGVTIPSQKRFVGYFQQFLREYYGPKRPFLFSGASLVLTNVRITALLPSDNSKRACNLYFKVLSLEGTTLYDSRQLRTIAQIPPIDQRFIDIPASVRVSGNIKVVFYDQQYGSDEKLFWCWFNTNFIHGNHLALSKFQLDKPHKDVKHKKYDARLMVEFSFRLDDIVVERPNDDVVRNARPHFIRKPIASKNSALLADNFPVANRLPDAIAIARRMKELEALVHRQQTELHRLKRGRDDVVIE